MAQKTITIEEWRKAGRDYKSGDPRKGTAKLVYLDDGGKGTVLGPVVVIDKNGKPIGPKDAKENKS